MFQVVLFSILISKSCAFTTNCFPCVWQHTALDWILAQARQHCRWAAPPSAMWYPQFDCVPWLPAILCACCGVFLVGLVGWVLFCFCFVQLLIRRLLGQLWVGGRGVQVFPQAKEEQESYLSRSPFLNVQNVGKDDNSSRLSRGVKTVLVGYLTSVFQES